MTGRLISRMLVAASLTVFAIPHAGAQAPERDIRLVLQITVDGFRGDLIRRYSDRFGEGGLHYLLDQGTVYTNAHYQHANTETIVGHTTLATGAYPADHGMVGNVWFDRDTGELSYNIEDPDHPLLPTREEKVDSAQLDPSQLASRTQGRSPSAILATTLSDELSVFHAGKPKIFGVSGKDRSAVAMAGHMGKAFWFSTDSGDFQTSAYYYESYPEWVSEWNALRQAESYSGKRWELLNPLDTYLLGGFDDRPYETDLKGYGRVFPHAFGTLDEKLYITRLFVSPVGDRLTLDFTKALITSERIGMDGVPDFLGVSFSSVDAVNHFFGPSSLENEDVVLQLDRTLADLFAFVDETVGLDHTIIVLSADHGMAEMPEFMAGQGLPAGRIYSDDVVEVAERIGREKFELENFVRSFFRPYLYLDANVIRAAGHDQGVVEQAIADAITAMDGISLAVSTRAIPQLQDTPTIAQIRRNTHSVRSGDIYVVQEPYWYLMEKGPIAVMHGAPWRYDTYVPIIFAGAGIKPKTVNRLVHPTDVAPTLANMLGVKPPSSSVGRPLLEVLSTSSAD